MHISASGRVGFNWLVDYINELQLQLVSSVLPKAGFHFSRGKTKYCPSITKYYPSIAQELPSINKYCPRRASPLPQSEDRIINQQRGSHTWKKEKSLIYWNKISNRSISGACKMGQCTLVWRALGLPHSISSRCACPGSDGFASECINIELKLGQMVPCKMNAYTHMTRILQGRSASI